MINLDNQAGDYVRSKFEAFLDGKISPINLEIFESSYDAKFNQVKIEITFLEKIPVVKEKKITKMSDLMKEKMDFEQLCRSRDLKELEKIISKMKKK